MQEEMYNLIGKYFSGQASAEESAMVEKWAAASEEIAADFRLLENLWNKSGQQERVIFNTEEAWQSVDAILKNNKGAKTINMFTRRAIVAAASVILLLGAWWLFFPSGAAHTITADANVKTVTMPDGSTIFLRKGSSVRYEKDFGKVYRNLTLNGEAFFDVKPDITKPFIITAASTQVQVVGTSFLVNTNNNQVALFVRTGKVNFGPAGEKVQVIAGEKALYAANKLTKENNTAENFDAWRSKQLVFDKTPFRQAIDDISNYYGVSIRLVAADAAQIGSTNITARFNDQPLQSALDELSLISGYRVHKVDETHFEISIK
jgi:ferric-dicitrate binding protein FerR (iron transport regulator)